MYTAPHCHDECQCAGWRSVYYGRALYPALIAAADAAVSGLLLSGLDAPDYERLDAFEGDEYALEPIRVIAGSIPVDAQAYLPARAVGTQARDWTFEHWTSHHRPDVIAQYRANGFSGD